MQSKLQLNQRRNKQLPLLIHHLTGPLTIETNASNSGEQLIYIMNENTTSQTSDPSQEIIMNCDVETLALLTSAATSASSSNSVTADCF